MNDGNLFNTGDEAPRDIVPPTGLTREILKRQNDATGKVVEGTIDGEVIPDKDGIPNFVGASRKVTSIFGGVVISRADAERLGIEDGDPEFSNVRIIDIPGAPK